MNPEDHTGKLSFPLVERFSRLSANQTTASQIPSLILTDVLASLLVGTKTAIHTSSVGYPATLAVNDPPSGVPRATVVVYRRVIRYNIFYAIPGLIALAVLAVVALWAAVVIAQDRHEAVRRLRDMYNQTSTGRLATSLLCPGRSDPDQPSREWIKGDGSLLLDFGRIGSHKSDHFLLLKEDDSGSVDPSKAENGVQRPEELEGQMK